jgi:hypothetical protein
LSEEWCNDYFECNLGYDPVVVFSVTSCDHVANAGAPRHSTATPTAIPRTAPIGTSRFLAMPRYGGTNGRMAENPPGSSAEDITKRG